MTAAEIAVLTALAPGGILSVRSLTRSVDLSEVRLRYALSRLRSGGQIRYGGMPGRSGYQITDRGRRALLAAPSQNSGVPRRRRNPLLHITSTENGEAGWHADGRHIAMESFTDYHSTTPAYRMRPDGTTVTIPNASTPGVVYFGEGDERPDLALVREWFAGHFALWDAVRAAYWDFAAPLGHSRLAALDYVAYDYRTGAWDAGETGGPT